jgi:hypothetical protein
LYLSGDVVLCSRLTLLTPSFELLFPIIFPILDQV